VTKQQQILKFYLPEVENKYKMMKLKLLFGG